MEWVLILSLYAGSMSSSGVGLTSIDGFYEHADCIAAGEQYKQSTDRGYYRCIPMKRELN